MICMAFGFPSTKSVFSTRVHWRESDDVDFPYFATVGDSQWKLRLNDFPEEPLLTLFIDDREWGHLDDWPAAWER